MRMLCTAVYWMPYGTPTGSRCGLEPGVELAAVLTSEYVRAVAAERRYDELRRTNRPALVRVGVASADIAQCIFEEFYSGTLGGFAR
jgi:hypothetical protein